MSPAGRPREFEDERKTISVTVAVEYLAWLDRTAAAAGISRARLLNEVIGIAAGLEAFGLLDVTAERTRFQQVPNSDQGLMFECRRDVVQHPTESRKPKRKKKQG